MRALLGAILVSTCLGGAGLPAFAADRPEILATSSGAPPVALPDFSYAGYGFGLAAIPEVRTVIDVNDYGAIPDDNKDDSAAILAAMRDAHAREGPVRVQFEAGRYLLSEIIWIEKSGIVLSGTGMGVGGTQIYMPRPLNQVDDGGALNELKEYLSENEKFERQKDANLDVIFSPFSWSGGFIWVRTPSGRHATYLERYDKPIEKIADIKSGMQFSRILKVDDAADLNVGEVLQINWHNRAGPDGPLVKSLYGDTKEKIGSRHWQMPDRPLVRQATEILSIDGDQIVIGDPLLHSIDPSLPAYFSKWEHLSEVGIQDLALVFPENPFFGHHNESGFNGIYFTGVYNGWIKSVRIVNSDSGILTDDLANVSIKNIITDGAHIAHYSVHIGNVHNVLVDSLTVFNPTIHTLSFNTQSTKSVYKDAVVWQSPSLDQHAGANHQNLYDNVTVHLVPDRNSSGGLASYDLFRAGGAGYWLPGHGKYNTNWNLNIIAEGGIEPGDDLLILGGSEGPDARIIGMHGNRRIVLDHRPEPYVEWLNRPVEQIPSLYAFQRSQRLIEGRP